MKVYRWEAGGRVVEIAATDLKTARSKGSVKLSAAGNELISSKPDNVKECRLHLGDCVKEWKTH